MNTMKGARAKMTQFLLVNRNNRKFLEFIQEILEKEGFGKVTATIENPMVTGKVQSIKCDYKDAYTVTFSPFGERVHVTVTAKYKPVEIGFTRHTDDINRIMESIEETIKEIEDGYTL